MTLLIGLVLLLFLILIHEAGHFLFARLCGVKVESFSIGMGPVLFHHETKKGTDFRISLIPLGGYCSMKGEKDLEECFETGNFPEDSFYGTHPLKRLLIAFAGPLANLVLSIVCFTGIALAGYTYWSAGNVVEVIEELDGEVSPAYSAGLRSGDEIISIDGKQVFDFSDISSCIAVKPLEEVRIEVLRNGETLLFTAVPFLDKDTGAGKIGVKSDPSSVKERTYPSLSFFPAVAEGTVKTFTSLAVTIKSVAVLFKGVNISKAVSGPLRITDFMGSSVREGFKAGTKQGLIMILELMGIISVSLFFTNMLPVGIFDGGLILTAFIEWISGRRLPLKVRQVIQYTGLFLVVLLMIFVLGSDILYFFRK